MRKTLTPGYRDLLSDKFDVVLHLEMNVFQRDFNKLYEILKRLPQPLKQNQRIVISHIDPDFYDNSILKHGMLIYNLITCFRNADVSLDFLILVTAHIGIKNEIEKIITENDSMPMVIETFVSRIFYKPYGDYTDYDLSAESIEKNCICMMGGTPRSHRYALFNFLADEGLLDKIAISI